MSQSKYSIKAVWLSLRGRQLRQNAYFLHAKCQANFRRSVAQKRGGRCTRGPLLK